MQPSVAACITSRNWYFSHEMVSIFYKRKLCYLVSISVARNNRNFTLNWFSDYDQYSWFSYAECIKWNNLHFGCNWCGQ